MKETNTVILRIAYVTDTVPDGHVLTDKLTQLTIVTEADETVTNRASADRFTVLTEIVAVNRDEK